MRITLENGILRNEHPSGSAVNNFLTRVTLKLWRCLVVGKLHAGMSINLLRWVFEPVWSYHSLFEKWSEQRMRKMALSLFRVDYNGRSSAKFRAKPRAEQFNERADTVAGLQQEWFRVLLKGRHGNNCHVAAVFERLWNLKHGYKMAKSRHKFKRFFHGWQVEKMASFSRYFQAVANWIWKGVSVTVFSV